MSRLYSPTSHPTAAVGFEYAEVHFVSLWIIATGPRPFVSAYYKDGYRNDTARRSRIIILYRRRKTFVFPPGKRVKRKQTKNVFGKGRRVRRCYCGRFDNFYGPFRGLPPRTYILLLIIQSDSDKTRILYVLLVRRSRTSRKTRVRTTAHSLRYIERIIHTCRWEIASISVRSHPPTAAGAGRRRHKRAIFVRNDFFF